MRSPILIFLNLSFALIWSCSCGENRDVQHEEADSKFSLSDVVFILCSQRNKFHQQKAESKRQRWLQELQNLNESSQIITTHDSWAPAGSWTILPLLSILSMKYAKKPPVYFFFAKEETEIDFVKLQEVMKRYDPIMHPFIGHALQDSTSSILHHFAPSDGRHAVKYPNFPSGWAMTYQLASSLAQIDVKSYFNIDPQFELAFLAKYKTDVDMVQIIINPDNFSTPDGVTLTHVKEFCIEQPQGGICATHYQQDIPVCDKSLSLSDIHIGVKTTEKYHYSRLPILKDTWGNDAGDSICYYSELEDKVAGTTSLGISNTETGYCSKMYAIMRRAATHNDISSRSWLIITDDDTILSVPRLLRMLACYDPDEAILMGEAYGFMAHKPVGYTYITGGGGMVLSRGAVQRIIRSGTACPQDDAPDDMFLGNTAKGLNIDVVSSNLFHQAQPFNYPPVVLARQTAISFHRHSEQDPKTVYQQYLKDHNDGTSDHFSADTMKEEL